MIVIQEQWDGKYHNGSGVVTVLQDNRSYEFCMKDWAPVSGWSSDDSPHAGEVAQWLIKTLMLIRKAEYQGYSADDCVGEYDYVVSLTKKAK